MKRQFVRIIILFILVFLSGCGAFIFYPEKAHYENRNLEKVNREDIFFQSADGTMLHGWVLTPKDDVPYKGTILHLHGNAQNISTHSGFVLWLVEAGYRAVVFDYRGYGKSEGSPSLNGVHLDGEAAIEKTLSLPGVAEEGFIILGQSLGGAIAIHSLANSPHKPKVKALVLESVFSDYRDIVREKASLFFLFWPLQYPISLTYNNSYSPVKWIKNVSPVPILILHGTGDPIVPHHHAALLYKAAAEPKTFWSTDPAGHTRSFADPAIRQKLLHFMEGL